MIITGRYGEYFALFQGLIPFFKKRHVLLDIEWRGERKSRSFNALKKLIHRIMAKGAEKIGVFCEVEAQHYSSYYGIEPDKFLWFPYCTDLEGQNFDVREDDYIFTGGVQQRDYETLFHAVKDIPIEVKVAAPLGSIDRGLISSNMNLLGVVGRDEYYKLMARSKLVVLSLVPDLRRCPGVITYVSAMRLGKTVIVNDLKGSRSYIENGKTGILVPPRDACALRDAVRTLLVEDELRREISKNAYLHAREHFSSRRLLADLSSIERRCGIEN